MLPANTMGANGKLRFEGSLRMSQNTNVKSISVRLGTTALPAAASLINSAGVSFTGRLKGREAVDAQHAELWTSGGNSLSVAPGLVGVDMTQPQSLNAALFMAVASDFLVLTDFEVIQEA